MSYVNFLYVGEPKDAFIRDGISEYEKRLGAFAKVRNICVKPMNPPDDPSESEINVSLEREADVIIEKLADKNIGRKIAMCIEGKQYDSEGFARMISDGIDSRGDVTFVIGSSHGLSERVKAVCDARISFSPMTFPHSLARLMLAEQVYRAFTIINNRKYHK